MKSYSILEILFQDYRNKIRFQNYKENKDSEELTRLYQAFEETLEDVDGENIKRDIERAQDNLELLSSKLAFEAGFKYGLQVAKECELI